MRCRLAPLLALPLLLTACSDGGGAARADRPTVVVGAYPFEWLVSMVGGEDVRVVNVVEPGVEPHDVELTPSQVAQVRAATVVFHLKGFQPALDDAVSGDNGADLATGLPLSESDEEPGEKDPHVWLDPVLMQQLATVVADRLGDADPAEADSYRNRAVTLTAGLKALDAEIQKTLSDCQRDDLVTSHAAFHYFAKRYGLVQRGIAGLDPEAEPSPKRLAEIAAFARDNQVTTIFFETLVSPKLAETVAAEVGAKTAVLDPLESVEGTDDYPTVMRRNAAALRSALGCTG